MTIIEILPQFLKGEKIRRESWDKNAYYQKDGIIVHFVFDTNGVSGDYKVYISEGIFSLDDIMSNDWTTKK